MLLQVVMVWLRLAQQVSLQHSLLKSMSKSSIRSLNLLMAVFPLSLVQVQMRLTNLFYSAVC